MGYLKSIAYLEGDNKFGFFFDDESKVIKHSINVQWLKNKCQTPQKWETYFIDDKVAHSANVDKFLVNQFSSDVVAGELNSKVLHYSKILSSDLRPDNWLTKDKKQGEDRQ